MPDAVNAVATLPETHRKLRERGIGLSYGLCEDFLILLFIFTLKFKTLRSFVMYFSK